jgi:hypothetical protein
MASFCRLWLLSQCASARVERMAHHFVPDAIMRGRATGPTPKPP